MQNEKRHIILSHLAYQRVSQGADFQLIFSRHRDTAVSDSGDGCLRFVTRPSQIQVTAVSGS